MSKGETTEIKQKVYYPQNVDYICAAFPPRRGYLSVHKSEADYELYNIKPGKMWEMIYPPSRQDWWMASCKLQYVGLGLGPDVVMIDEHIYTTYINLF